jgi:hypothetical protein
MRFHEKDAWIGFACRCRRGASKDDFSAPASLPDVCAGNRSARVNAHCHSIDSEMLNC